MQTDHHCFAEAELEFADYVDEGLDVDADVAMVEAAVGEVATEFGGCCLGLRVCRSCLGSPFRSLQPRLSF